MSDATHTPTPYEVQQLSHVDDQLWLQIGYKGRGPIVRINCEAEPMPEGIVAESKLMATSEEQQWANARFIVRACNSHDALVEIKQQFKALTVYGWEVEKASLYDEEGVEGWRWTEPNGTEHYEIGDWNELPTWPDSAEQALADAEDPPVTT